ncbi:MAG TPA: hypothetical protein PKA76_14675 [Pirellulaceae bacterium]|nr:hypothetical protein [Pirellulaceae bacterium]
MLCRGLYSVRIDISSNEDDRNDKKSLPTPGDSLPTATFRTSLMGGELDDPIAFRHKARDGE